MKENVFYNTSRTLPEFSESLQTVTDILDVPHTKSPTSIIEASQIWRRQPDQERWELPELPLRNLQRKQLINKLKELGFISEIKPRKFNYH